MQCSALHIFFTLRIIYNQFVPYTHQQVIFPFILPLQTSYPNFRSNLPIQTFYPSFLSIVPTYLSYLSFLFICHGNLHTDRKLWVQTSKTLSWRVIFDWSNLSLLFMSYFSPVVVGTAPVYIIEPEDPAGLQRKLHEHEEKRRSPEEDLFFFRAILIITIHNILPYPYNFNKNNEVPAMVTSWLP